MGQHVQIFEKYIGDTDIIRFRPFPGPTATRRCSCFLNVMRYISPRFITAQCTLVHLRGLGIACRPSVCPSVCDVGDL